jgi:hypothetical protein
MLLKGAVCRVPKSANSDACPRPTAHLLGRHPLLGRDGGDRGERGGLRPGGGGVPSVEAVPIKIKLLSR